MTLPILISNPHAGLQIPPEVESLCLLTEMEIFEDGDEGAREIYDIENEVAAFHTTEIARAFVDLNRAVDDRRTDGIVKTHTCWQVPVYEKPLPEVLVTELLEKYYHPYHQNLTESAKTGVLVGIDCHTMAAKGPPIGPDPGSERPAICLSNADGTCPQAWLESLAEILAKTYGREVRINKPFQGGFITRSHASELPWLQLEFSRAPFLSYDEKRRRLLDGLREWCEWLNANPRPGIN